MHNQIEKVELTNLLASRIKQKKAFESYSFEERNLFAEVWNSIAFKIGIREALVKAELNIIFDFLKNHFNLFSLNDIREAFDCYAAQKLNFKDSHFQSLDNVFIGRVLSSYKQFIADELSRKPKPIVQKPTKELTYDEIKFEAEESLKAYKEAEDLKDFNWIYIYNYYRDKGLISFEGNEAKEFQEVVKRELIQEVKAIQEAKKNATYTLLILEIKTLFYAECKKRAVLRYYNKLTNE